MKQQRRAAKRHVQERRQQNDRRAFLSSVGIPPAGSEAVADAIEVVHEH